MTPENFQIVKLAWLETQALALSPVVVAGTITAQALNEIVKLVWHETQVLASSPATVAGTITAQALNEVVDMVANDVYKNCARNARAIPYLKKIEEDGFNLINSSSSDSNLKKNAQNSPHIFIVSSVSVSNGE